MQHSLIDRTKKRYCPLDGGHFAKREQLSPELVFSHSKAETIVKQVNT
ncbi:hypothetical protein [Xanthocytophaga flava]|nr:hypothetical protein [Xanthocytophaga flavus]MDJ1471007.1 hypothetical protein [Xanthocytophaga flavus]